MLYLRHRIWDTHFQWPRIPRASDWPALPIGVITGPVSATPANRVGTVGSPYPLFGKKLAIAAQTFDREMGVLTGPNPNSKQIDWTEVRAGRE